MSASAPKKKINRADYMFAQLKDQTVVKKPGQVEGFQFAIRYLENCTASLYDYSAQVMIDQCKNSTITIGPCSGSVFFRDCEDCTIYVAC